MDSHIIYTLLGVFFYNVEKIIRGKVLYITVNTL
ncbi:hypothetical protein CY0110_19642 [Crocosphaera chwakensis CCY0110]|uniref:Uncharacterized protein n=1 Tax=Crocosphaera chwakensis CCY0110 TaxID=391612 RepID=A3IJR0_9CHRO|nr:hypothetical protein CY0110_19642 [Crocosphaera chwakensis CCY0110]